MIHRYLTAVDDLGSLQIDGRSVRSRLQNEADDLWFASTVRESSLWTDDRLFERLGLLTGNSQKTRPSSTTSATSRLRVAAVWCRALAHSLRTRRRTDPTEVMFVEYLPPTYTAGRHGESQYFGNLPTEVRRLGRSVGFLHIHSEGPVTRAPREIRKLRRQLSTKSSPHVLLTDYFTFGVWWKALRSWRALQQHAPSISQIDSSLIPGTDLSLLWPTWRSMYDESIRGTHSVRTSLLTAMFREALRKNKETVVWLSAFEGQSWEATFARNIQRSSATWIPYLHTMLRPWDLRARTFVKEFPPHLLAVHGQHDLSELESLHPSLVLVEALRYGHLAAESGQKRPPRFDDTRWLIVGGAECDRSNRELQEVLTAMRLQSVTPHVVIKWHPQCGAPTVELPDNASVSGEPLASLIDKTSVALMVGSAAPLDTYLRGIPSCSLRTPSGFSMTPVEESENFHTARDASDAVSWLLAAQSKPSFTPPVERYFSLDAALPRWRSLLASVLAD